VFHSTYTHRNRVNSRLLMIGSQIANLTPGPSFDHDLCCRCPNGSCKAILDIYISRPFQRYKKRLDARCFDPYNHVLSLRESRRTPKSHFRECEWQLHISLKVGLRHYFFHFDQRLELCTLWTSMDVIHTLIDMVYTLLLLYMEFCMKITLYIDIHPNMFYFH
jgi:hypothetical protein